MNRYQQPPKRFCRECGRDVGRRWTDAVLCRDCAKADLDVECVCDFNAPETWAPEVCPLHPDYNPYDIPY